MIVSNLAHVLLDRVLHVELALLQVAAVRVLHFQLARHLRQLRLQAEHLAVLRLQLQQTQARSYQ